MNYYTEEGRRRKIFLIIYQKNKYTHSYSRVVAVAKIIEEKLYIISVIIILLSVHQNKYNINDNIYNILCTV